jgi:hypothetical protein
MQIGISESDAAPSASGAWLTITPDVTHLGVVEFDFASKQSNLYVFSAFPETQPNGGYVTSAAAASISNIGAVMLRQYNKNQRVTVDGIRIATTWEEAVEEATVPPTFTERPAVDTALIIATKAAIRVSADVVSTLHYTLKTAPVADITAADIASDPAKDSVTANANQDVTVSFNGLTMATKYYVYFTAQNKYGFSAVDSAVFTTLSTMVANPGFERWTGTQPNMWTIATKDGKVVKDTLIVSEGKYSAKVDARFGRVDMRQTVYGVVPGRRYKISFRYYRDAIFMGNGIRFWSNFCNGATAIEADSILHRSGYLKGNGEAWTQFVIEDYAAPDSADSFNFEVRTMEDGTAYFDDFCFTEADTMPSIGVTPESLLLSAIAGESSSQNVQVTTTNISGTLAVSISGDNASYFSAPATLASGAAQTLTVIYAPGDSGSHSATLTIAGGGITRTVTLTGTATVSDNSNNDLSSAITPISSICTGAESPYDGKRVTIAGIVTAVTKNNSFFVQSGSGAGSGIYAYRRGDLVQAGDSVLVTGWIDEFNKRTEITVNDDAHITVVSSGNAPPPTTAITVNQMGKAYYSVLLSVSNVEVSKHATDAAKYMVGSNGNTLVVAQEISATQPTAGVAVNITGIGFYNAENQLLPRSASDVEIVKDASTATPKLHESDAAIYPNPGNDLLHVKSAYGVAKIEVYTLSGAIALQKKFASSVSIASLQPGDYVVRVIFANGLSLSKIITKK